LLIRGDPGTGKTSLALQLLEYYSRKGKKALYVSTRLSVKSLRAHQPWLEIVGTKQGSIPTTKEQQVAFQDSRRNEGSTSISNVRYILEKFPDSFVVFDSWEGLVFESPALATEEITRLVEDYDAKFVVVVERSEQSDLDYIVDGVVVLRKEVLNARTIREFELKKLRGVRVDQSKFLFSLFSGRHVFLPPFLDNNDEFSGRRIIGEKTKGENSDSLSTGSFQLDSIFGGGGLHRGSVNLLEFSEIVPKTVQKLILRTVMLSAMENNYALIYLPYGNTSVIEFENLISGVIDIDKDKDSIRVFSYGGSSKTKIDPLVLEGDPHADFVSLEATSNELRSRTKKPILSILGIDTLEALYGSSNISKPLGQSIAYVKSNRDVRIQVANSGAGTLLQLSGLADTHVRVDIIDGTPVIYGIKPASEYYAIIRSEAENEFRLLAIV
jgi:KaiC/GvpD/RAD55 family RecA-like ATPase